MGRSADMLGQDSLERAVRAARIDAPPRFLERTGSTNADALSLAERGAPEWTVVAAGHQTAGRGRLGRSWTSAPGKSLLFSLILHPSLPPDRARLISLLAAERMADACSGAGVEARCKWPNDVVVGERKLAGILVEARVAGGRLEHLVVGLGVNVSMAEDDFPGELRGRSTSLALEAAPEPDPAALLSGFLSAFRARYRPEDPRFPEEVVAAYAPACATLGRWVRATTTAGEIVEGTATAVTADGALVVEAEGRRHAVAAGELEHLR